MKKFLAFLTVAILGVQLSAAVSTPGQQADSDISGMYSFLEEGEFVQISVEAEAGQPVRLTGFISRYGHEESDQGLFLDHFFSKGSLKDSDISFTTKPVHGIWFEFKGKVEKDPQKTPSQQGYFSLHGTLTQFSQSEGDKVQSKSREVVFKSFPREMPEAEEKKDPKASRRG